MRARSDWQVEAPLTSPGDVAPSTDVTPPLETRKPAPGPVPAPDPDRAFVSMIIADLSAGVDEVAPPDPGHATSLASRSVRPRITLPEPSAASVVVGSVPEEQGRSHRRLWAMAAVLLGCVLLVGSVAVELTDLGREVGIASALRASATPGQAVAGPSQAVASADAGSPSPVAGTPSPVPGSPSPIASSPSSAPTVGVTMGPPTATLGRRLTSSGIELNVAWTPPADGSRVSRYDLQVARDGGSYQTVNLARKTSRSATVAAIADHDYALQLRARASDGAPGPWVTSSVRVSRHEESGPDVRVTKGWKIAHHPAYTGAGARYATLRGAELSLAFDGTAVAIIGPTGPGRGRADVSVDGQHVGRFDAKGVHFKPVQLLLTVDGLVPGPHVLSIRVLGTPGRPMVAVDKFLVLDQP